MGSCGQGASMTEMTGCPAWTQAQSLAGGARLGFRPRCCRQRCHVESRVPFLSISRWFVRNPRCSCRRPRWTVAFVD